MFQSKWNTKRHINTVHDYGTQVIKHDDTQKKWVKDHQDQVAEIQCGENYGHNFKHDSRNDSFELITTNAEAFNTGLLNSEKHNIISKQSSSFSDSGPPVHYQFVTAPVQDLKMKGLLIQDFYVNKKAWKLSHICEKFKLSFK